MAVFEKSRVRRSHLYDLSFIRLRACEARFPNAAIAAGLMQNKSIQQLYIDRYVYWRWARWGFGSRLLVSVFERMVRYGVDKSFRRNLSLRILSSISNRATLKTSAIEKDLEPRPGALCINSLNSSEHSNRRLGDEELQAPSVLVSLGSRACCGLQQTCPKGHYKGQCASYSRPASNELPNQVVGNEVGAFRKDLIGRSCS
jgi:hypothetical protein